MLLSELLENAPEARLELLNPGAHIKRLIVGIDSSETPDIAEYIAKDTLLLTTAMMFADKPSGLVELIKQLHAAKAAGIAIKLGRFITNISPEVLEAATQLKFPVFTIPIDTTLGITYHKLQSCIWDVETRQIYQALDIQKAMSKMMFAGATIPVLLGYLACAIERQVYYFDSFFDVLAVASGEASSAAPAVSVGADRPSSQILHSAEYATSNADRAIATALGDALRKAQQFSPITSLDELHLDTTSGEIDCIVSPIEAGDAYPNYLVIVYERSVPEPLLHACAEQAATVLSFHMHNANRLTKNEWHLKEEHFQRLLQLHPRNDPSFIDTYRLVFAFPLLDLAKYQIVVVGFDATELPEQIKHRDHLALVNLWLEKRVDTYLERCLILPLRESNQLLLFIRESKTNLTQLLQSAAEDLHQLLPLQIRFGVSDLSHRLEVLNSSYIEAGLAMQKALDDLTLPAVQFYSSAGIDELIQFAPSDHVRHYCTQILQALAYPQDEYLLMLRETLEVYLSYQGDLTATAKALFIHRNTVRYRIGKIQNLLTMPLDNAEHTLQLRLAIHLSASKSNAD